MRTGEIPLIGVVNMEPMVEPPALMADAPVSDAVPEAAAKRTRKPAARGKPRAPKIAAAMESAPPVAEAKPEGKPVRKRARPRAKKAE
jgi:hypothetical protein